MWCYRQTRCRGHADNENNYRQGALKSFDLVANIDIRHSYLQSSWLRNLIGIPLKFGNPFCLLLVISSYKEWFLLFLIGVGAIPEAIIRKSARIFLGAWRGDFSLVQPRGSNAFTENFPPIDLLRAAALRAPGHIVRGHACPATTAEVCLGAGKSARF